MTQRVRAILQTKNKFVLIRRVKNGREYWVFPGGKVEKTDKDKAAALRRECREELGVRIAVGKLLWEESFDYVGEKRQEFFYLGKIINGQLGSGKGSEFGSGRCKGIYGLDYVALKDFPGKNIQPEKVKKKIMAQLKNK